MYTIVIRDTAYLMDKIGMDLLSAFAQCFVHADRLTSLWHFGYRSKEACGENSIAVNRDHRTMFWFAAGTLWEAGSAVGGLRQASIENHITRKDLWGELQNLVSGWRKLRHLKHIRNKASFHVDPRVINKGLQNIIGKSHKLCILTADGNYEWQSDLVLGDDALIQGSGLSESDLTLTLKVVHDGHFRFGEIVQTLFIDMMETSGFVVEGMKPD